jgi:hypothetical protein
MAAERPTLCRVRHKTTGEYLGNGGYQRLTSRKGKFYDTVPQANSFLCSSVNQANDPNHRIEDFEIIEYELKQVATHPCVDVRSRKQGG